MKKSIRSFVTFTRTERIGLVCLCGLLLVFIVIRVTMCYWVHPTSDADKEQKINAAWEVFKRSQQDKKDANPKGNREYEYTADSSQNNRTDIIDLNTADSVTLVSLKGIGPVTAGKIVARRNTRGPFTDINQLKEVGSFSAATFELLKKQLTIITIRNADSM